jgi:TrpR family transcriptional regulator, trp operon repressor
MPVHDDIIKVFCEVQDIKTMKKLFDEIFTSSELQDVALRWRLMSLLHDGLSQRQISARLGVSLCKITRGSRILKNKRSVVRKILDQNEGENNVYDKKIRRRTG